MALSGTYDINANPASAADQIAPPVTRLSLDRATLRQAGIHGGWWPRSRDAAAELPGLLSELNTHAGRVSRVALQAAPSATSRISSSSAATRCTSPGSGT
jgi:hypothetical protein